MSTEMQRDRDSLDMAEVRRSFPALGREQVYLDNSGGSQTLGAVADRIRDYLLTTNVQLGASYATSKRASWRHDEGHAACARYMNASPEELVLATSATQLLRNLSFAMALAAGDELVLSRIDHEANIAPWLDLAARQDLVVRWWEPDAGTNPKLRAADLTGLVTARTRLVACTHASNLLGSIHDIKAISRAAHELSPRALVVVDGVAYAPHRPVDVQELGVDFYTFSWYKVYGPHVAVLYGSSRAQAQLRSLGFYVNPHDTLERKLGLAGSAYELVHAIPAVVAYLGRGPSNKWPAIRRQEALLQRILLRWLCTRTDVIIWGERSADPDLRLSTVSFTVAGRKARDLVEAVESTSDFGFRWGTFYSARLAELLGVGVDGVVRVSMVHYNTVSEIEGLIAVLERVLGQLGG